jgi:hypothetical protein
MSHAGLETKRVAAGRFVPTPTPPPLTFYSARPRARRNRYIAL